MHVYILYIYYKLYIYIYIYIILYIIYILYIYKKPPKPLPNICISKKCVLNKIK